MCSTPPPVIDTRFVDAARVRTVVEEAVTALTAGNQMIIVCNEEAVSACRAAVEEQERVAWDVLDASHRSTYVRIRRLH